MQSLCPTSCSNQRLAHGLLCKELEVHGVVLPVHVQDAAFGRWQDALGRVALHAVVVGVNVLAQSIPPTATATGGNRDSPLIQLCKWEWYRSEEQQTDISFPFKKRTRTLRKKTEKTTTTTTTTRENLAGDTHRGAKAGPMITSIAPSCGSSVNSSDVPASCTCQSALQARGSCCASNSSSNSSRMVLRRLAAGHPGRTGNLKAHSIMLLWG